MRICGASFSASQNSGGVLVEAPRIRPALSEDRRHGHFLRRRIMEWLIGVVIWLVLAGGLLALFSDDGRGE